MFSRSLAQPDLSFLIFNIILGTREKVFIYFYDLVQMVFELSILQLAHILLAQYHVLDQLNHFIMELYNIGLFVHKVLNAGPVLKELVLVNQLVTFSLFLPSKSLNQTA